MRSAALYWLSRVNSQNIYHSGVTWYSHSNCIPPYSDQNVWPEFVSVQALYMDYIFWCGETKRDSARPRQFLKTILLYIKCRGTRAKVERPVKEQAFFEGRWVTIEKPVYFFRIPPIKVARIIANNVGVKYARTRPTRND